MSGNQNYTEIPIQFHIHIHIHIHIHLLHLFFNRFDQPGLRKVTQMEQVLLSASKGEETTRQNLHFLECYPELNVAQLLRELPLFNVILQQGEVQTFEHFHDILKCIEMLPQSTVLLIPNILQLMKLIMVFPSTAASSERSFSVLRRIKTHMRSTMSQKRLTEVSLCHVHKKRTMLVDVKDVSKTFINNSSSNERKHVFGVYV